MQVLKPLLVAGAASFGALVLSLFVEPLPETAALAADEGARVAEAPARRSDEFRARQFVSEQALDEGAVDALSDLADDRRAALERALALPSGARGAVLTRLAADLARAASEIVGREHATAVLDWLGAQERAAEG